MFVWSSLVIATVALLSFFFAESATESISLATDAVYVMVFDANAGFSVTVLSSVSCRARLLSVASVEAVVLSGGALIAMSSMADAAGLPSVSVGYFPQTSCADAPVRLTGLASC